MSNIHSFPKEEPDFKVINSKRPWFLSLLCIFSFIATGIVLILSVIALIFSNTIYQKLMENPNIDYPYRSEKGILVTAIVLIVINVIKMYAIANMWHGRRWGYWTYVIVQIIIIVLSFSRFIIALNIILILLYLTQYGFLKRRR